MAEKINTAQYKSDVRQWSRQQLAELKRNVRVLTNKQKHVLIKTIRIKGLRKLKSSAATAVSKHKYEPKSKEEKGKLLNSLKANVRTKFDFPERIIFPFARHGIFIAKGVSRGHPMGSERYKIDWFDSSLDAGIEELANIVVKHQADAALGKISKIGK